jgi:hypothetical protein
LIVMLVAGTAFATFMRPPEERTAQTDDGTVRVRALIRGVAEGLEVDAGEFAPEDFTALNSPVFQVVYRGDGLGNTVAVRVTRGADWLGEWPPEELQFLVRDPSIGAWRNLGLEVDVPAGVMRAELPTRYFQGNVARFAFGRPDTGVSLPDRTAVIVDELRANPPPNAVGYRAFVSYADVDQDFVLLAEPLEYGGCGGRFISGDETTLTSQDLQKDDRTYRFGIIWELKGYGCADEQDISVYKTFMNDE